jgi:ATP-dependent Clp protease protease subunit
MVRKSNGDSHIDDEDEDEDTEEEHSLRQPKILKERAILMLSGMINNNHLGICNELLAYHFRPDFNEPITLLINSPGGSCEIGWAIVDTMNFIRLPVNTVCIGCAASMAADIFINGDHRVMGEHATLMIHQHHSMNMGSHSRLIATLKGDVIEHNRRLQHYITNSKYPNKQQVEEHLLGVKGEDLYLDPQECLNHGLIDEIAFSNKKDKRRKNPATGKGLLGQFARPITASKSKTRSK